MSEKTFMKLMFFASLILIALLLGSMGTRYKVNGEDYYNVKSGDSLWKIASEYKPEDMDTREYIQVLKEANEGLENKILPGQAIIVPRMEEI